MARANLLVTSLVAVLALAVPALALGATGLDIESQRSLLSSLDAIGTRTMTIVSRQAPIIPAAAVDRIAHLSGVEWVVGLGPVSDVRDRGGGGSPTPMRTIREVGAPITISGSPTGALVSRVSARRGGLGGAYSVLDPGSLAVDGWFSARDPVGDLNAFILLPREDDAWLAERLIVSVTDVSQVEPVAAAVDAMIGREASQGTTIERSPALLLARQAVQDQVARTDRLLVLLILTATVALASVVVLSGVIATRRDLGRRRALGATRLQLTVLVLLETFWPATLGTAVGTATGWLYVSTRAGYLVDWRFPVSVGALTVLALLAAAAPPAVWAATRDPLRVLRMP